MAKILSLSPSLISNPPLSSSFSSLNRKYAQGMANYEKNTGKPFHQAQEEAQISNKAKHEAEINLEGGIGEDSKVNQAGEKKEL